MSKEKQIEEIYNLLFCDKWEQPFTECPEDIKCIECIAKRFYEQGYRKITEDSVIIPKSEYNKITLLAKECIEWRGKNCNTASLPKEDSVVLTEREHEIAMKNQYDVGFGFGYKKGCKETAEKILDLLVPDCKACDENWHSGCLCLRATLAEKIAKQFGVEIKE